MQRVVAQMATVTNQRALLLSNPNNVVLATYQGGKLLDPDYGRTVIDGSDIKTATISAAQLVKTAALITQSAQMGNAVVDTLSIAGNAVSVPAAASASATVVLDDATERTLLCVTITRQGAPTLVWATCQMGGAITQSIAKFRLYRGAVLLEDFPGVTGSRGAQTALAFSWRDPDMGSGATTYHLKVVRATDGDYTGNPHVVNRTLTVLHVMR